MEEIKDMAVWLKNEKRLVCITEGSGCNIDASDRELGYVASAYITVYDTGFQPTDGGELLLTEEDLKNHSGLSLAKDCIGLVISDEAAENENLVFCMNAGDVPGNRSIGDVLEEGNGGWKNIFLRIEGTAGKECVFHAENPEIIPGEILNLAAVDGEPYSSKYTFFEMIKNKYLTDIM